jgi:tetratricopeptide (TPR) repeat protein
MPINVEALWDFTDPAESERRFRDALDRAEGDDALILQTQIARTLGLRGRFDEAHELLDDVSDELEGPSPELRVRNLLERGRIFRSSESPVEAESCFSAAFALADSCQLEFLAADALHMIALVQDTPEGRLDWNQRTVDYARAALDRKARAWESSALNNIGVVLNDLGRHNEALERFQDALAAYERDGRAADARIARWMVASTLRRLDRSDEALDIQLALEAELDAVGETDPYVYDEIALLLDARGDAAGARRYRALHERALGEPAPN